MNDEIKEIIDEFLKEKSAYSLRYSFNGDLAYSQEQILKDYITNLQQENDILNDITESYEETSKEQHEEIEKLNLELSGYREAILRDDKLLGLKSRIDKAIKIIQNDTTLNPPRQRDRLINLLNGGDEE